MKLTMHLDEARGGRFSVLFSTAATLFGVFGVISVARASAEPMVQAPATFAMAATREGVMTERLRDVVTFERTDGEAFVVVASSR